jgi:tetratricopeptide (TPR) repeat protein
MLGMLWLLWSPLAVGGSLESPEMEFKKAQDRLQALADQVRATRNLVKQPGMARQQQMVDQIFDTAQNALATGDYVRTVRELQYYLSETQIPNPAKYMTAQKMLGDAYLAMGYSSKSMRAYRRFLATFLTAKQDSFGELTEVLRKTSHIAANELRQDRKELTELLSSVTALSFPAEIHAEVLYWSARTAAMIKEPELAKDWFARIRSISKDPHLKARSLYFSALVAIHQGEMDTADQALSEALQLEIGQQSQEADSIRIALARTASERGLFKRAQEFYSQIKEGSHEYRNAQYDLIYVNVRLGKFPEAAAIAKQYVTKFKDDRQIVEVNNLLGYLSLHEAKFAETNEHLAKSESHVIELQKWVRQVLSSPDTVTASLLRELNFKTSGIATPSPLVTRAIEHFNAIGEQRQRVADQEAEIRNAVIAIGSSRFNQINPLWANTTKSLEGSIHGILDVGHRIAATERYMLEKRLSPADLHRLQTLEKRRQEIANGRTRTGWVIDQYRNWVNNQIILERVKRSFNTLNKQRLRLVSSEYASSIRGNQTLEERDYQKLQNTKERINHYAKSLGIVSLKLQERNISDLTSQSDHQSLKRLLSRFANVLHEEATILEKYRDETQGTPEKFLALDAQKTWEHWRLVSKAAYEQVFRLDTEIRQEVTSMMNNIQTLTEQSRRASTAIDVEQNRLERTLAKSSPNLLSHYSRQLENHLARIRKWKGDLESLKFRKLQSSNSELNARLDLQREIARSSYEAALQRGL